MSEIRLLPRRILMLEKHYKSVVLGVSPTHHIPLIVSQRRLYYTFDQNFDFKM